MSKLTNFISSFFKGSSQPDALVSKESRGTVRYATFPGVSREAGQPSPENLNIVLDLFQKDPVVQAAITTRKNAILASGWTIEGPEAPKEQAKRTLKSVKFNDLLLEHAVVNGLTYDHAFIEVERRNNGQPNELYVLETPFMEIRHNVHGEILDFVQRGETDDVVIFPTDDISYMVFNRLTTGVWGEVSLRTLYRTIASKNYFEKFLNFLAETNQYRPFIVSKMGDDDTDAFMSHYVQSMQNPYQPILVQASGKDVKDVINFGKLRDSKELSDFLGVLDYLRTQMLMQLKVPPIMIGLPDSSNRSNSDSQIKAFNIENDAFRKKFADYVNYDLFPKLGISPNVKFSWNPIDKRSEKDDVEIAERLMNMGADPKKVEEFLRNAGLELPDGELFVNSVPPKKSMDMFESRRGKAEGEANQNIGSGEDSTTREDQLE